MWQARFPRSHRTTAKLAGGRYVLSRTWNVSGAATVPAAFRVLLQGGVPAMTCRGVAGGRQEEVHNERRAECAACMPALAGSKSAAATASYSQVCRHGQGVNRCALHTAKSLACQVSVTTVRSPSPRVGCRTTVSFRCSAGHTGARSL